MQLLMQPCSLHMQSQSVAWKIRSCDMISICLQPMQPMGTCVLEFIPACVACSNHSDRSRVACRIVGISTRCSIQLHTYIVYIVEREHFPTGSTGGRCNTGGYLRPLSLCRQHGAPASAHALKYSEAACGRARCCDCLLIIRLLISPAGINGGR